MTKSLIKEKVFDWQGDVTDLSLMAELTAEVTQARLNERMGPQDVELLSFCVFELLRRIRDFKAEYMEVFER